HGVTVGAESCALAFDELYFLERACRQQVLAASMGMPLKIIPDAMIEQTAREWRQVMAYQADRHFEAMIRMHAL
ncbi:MAG: aldolase/adducin, partial [Beijerinckiaceae bacterium]